MPASCTPARASAPRTRATRSQATTPAFAISNEYAKHFMKSFVGDETATTTFDTAAGLAAHHAMLAGASADAAGLSSGKTPHWFSEASGAYGSVAGSENAAQVEVVGKQVEDEEHAKELMKSVLSVGVDMLPMGKLAEDGGSAIVHIGEDFAGTTAGDIATYAGSHLANASDSWWDASKHADQHGLGERLRCRARQPGPTRRVEQRPAPGGHAERLRAIVRAQGSELAGDLEHPGRAGRFRRPAQVTGPGHVRSRSGQAVLRVHGQQGRGDVHRTRARRRRQLRVRPRRRPAATVTLPVTRKQTATNESASRANRGGNGPRRRGADVITGCLQFRVAPG